MPLLLRLNAGNESLENIHVCHHSDTQANYIIKRNLRRDPRKCGFQLLNPRGLANTPREGKGEYFGVNGIFEKSFERKLRQVFHVVELYYDHGTSEQFHSEIKTDLDLERLPAGKFATNDAQ
jgi:hypothetical protein